jgi:phage/plasmid-like protein (TIGR03299 family)
MAHEIEVVDNIANMMYVGDAPWHKLGTKFEVAPTLDTAIMAAGLDWNVILKPLFTGDGISAPANATVRESDGSILGVVGPGYKPLQNQKAFDFFKFFVNSGAVTVECAGSLRNGRRVFILCKINKDPIVVKGNDIVQKYVLLSNSHDGTMAVRAGFSGIRVVCANTLAMALGADSSKLLRIRHTKSVNEALDEVAQIMNIADQSFDATAEQYRRLAAKSVNVADLDKYVRTVFKLDDEGDSRVIDQVIPLFEKGRGNDMPEIKGTYWAAMNAVSEYVQYERGSSDDTRLDQTWFGAGQTLNKRALEVALEMAA